METVSVHLPFSTIRNCRDLGGIQTRDGRVIAPSTLLRSANLAHAGRQDLLTLEYMNLKTIIDLRTPQEHVLAPDRICKGARLLKMPVYKEKDIARKARGQIHLAEEAAMSMHEVFLSIYGAMIMDPDSQKAWKQFFQTIAASEGMLLWHCTQGKDRTGMAAALLLHLLDVDEQTVFNEYMQTNLYMTRNDEKDRLLAALLPAHGIRHLADEDIDAAVFASPAYYHHADTLIKEHWGSWKNYLRQAIGIDESLEQAIRQRVLMTPEK